MRLRVCLLTLAALSAGAAAGRAGLIISVTPPAGGFRLVAGTGTLTIPVTVTDTAASPEYLGDFTAAFDIQAAPNLNATAPVTPLEFVSPDDPTTDPTLTDPNYVYSPSNQNFTGSASFKAHTPQVFGQATDPGGTGFATHFVGTDIEDGTDPAGGAPLSGGYRVVLADLVVRFNGGSTANAPGDVFNLSLDLSDSSFHDPFGGSLLVAGPTSGDLVLAIVTVENATQAVPTPEPSTWLLALTGAGLVGLHAWRRRSPPRH